MRDFSRKPLQEAFKTSLDSRPNFLPCSDDFCMLSLLGRQLCQLWEYSNIILVMSSSKRLTRAETALLYYTDYIFVVVVVVVAIVAVVAISGTMSSVYCCTAEIWGSFFVFNLRQNFCYSY